MPVAPFAGRGDDGKLATRGDAGNALQRLAHVLRLGRELRHVVDVLPRTSTALGDPRAWWLAVGGAARTAMHEGGARVVAVLLHDPDAHAITGCRLRDEDHASVVATDRVGTVRQGGDVEEEGAGLVGAVMRQRR